MAALFGETGRLGGVDDDGLPDVGALEGVSLWGKGAKRVAEERGDGQRILWFDVLDDPEDLELIIELFGRFGVLGDGGGDRLLSVGGEFCLR